MTDGIKRRWVDIAKASIGLTFFRSAAHGLHVPTDVTRDATKHEARKRRASERPRVGCCEELARVFLRL